MIINGCFVSQTNFMQFGWLWLSWVEMLVSRSRPSTIDGSRFPHPRPWRDIGISLFHRQKWSLPRFRKLILRCSWCWWVVRLPCLLFRRLSLLHGIWVRPWLDFSKSTCSLTPLHLSIAPLCTTSGFCVCWCTLSWRFDSVLVVV